MTETRFDIADVT